MDMSEIQLVGISRYAKSRNINRSTVWRQIKNDEIDYFTIEGSNKKLLRLKEPDYNEKERYLINKVLSYDYI